jgi:hypothetical protein
MLMDDGKFVQLRDPEDMTNFKVNSRANWTSLNPTLNAW